MRNKFSALSVYKKKSKKSEVVTQLLYGETFKILKRYGSWIKVKNDLDNYIGYIKNSNFPKKQKNTHKVFKIISNLYTKTSNNSKIKKKLSFSSRVKVGKKINNFYKIENLWVKCKDLKKINHTNKNIFLKINEFKNIKYKWGGKHFAGVDCSGLIQLFFNYNNKFCPRDAKDQIKYFKKKILLKNIKKNDLIFWKGHVALVITKNELIHAYGPFKKVAIMSIKKTIRRIQKTANLRVTGIRRP